MSGISKKMLQAAAGGGAERYWISTTQNGSIYNPQLNDIALDSVGNIYAAGNSDQNGGNTQKGFIYKYTADGEVEWARTVQPDTTSFQVRLACVAVDSNDNVIAGGIDTTGVGNGLLVKFNGSGTQVWQKRFSEYYGTPEGVAIGSNDDIYVSTGAFYIVKLNSSGVVQWTKRLGSGSGGGGVNGCFVDGSDNVYIVGQSYAVYPQGEGILAKYNSSGTLQFQRSVRGGGQDLLYDVAVDQSGNIYTAGFTASVGAGGNDLLLVKHNSSGTAQWARVLGTFLTEFGYAVSLKSDGNIVVSGQGYGGATGSSVLVAEYNPSGDLQWANILGTATGSSAAYGVAVGAKDNIAICGELLVSNGTTIAANLPGDGAGAGTYGPYEYFTFSGVSVSASLTFSTLTLPDVTPSAMTTIDNTRTSTLITPTNTLYDITP